VLGEPLTGRMVAAFALILAGSVLATRSGLRPGRPAGDAAVRDRQARLESRG
jgi:drug/metabolite transporter (DMT)-like permease